MNEPQKNYTNGVLMTLSVIGMKWKPLILCHLVARPQRPAELKRVVQGISAKVLTDQLRELERDGIITRKVFNEVPPHVEYATRLKTWTATPKRSTPTRGVRDFCVRQIIGFRPRNDGQVGRR